MYFMKADFSEIYARGGEPYYGGDRMGADDIEVPQRPSSAHVWNGSGWVQDAALAAAAAKDELTADLSPSDAQGIRFAEELFAALKAKGVLTDTDINATALANVNARRAIRGQPAL